jgi:CRISPR-associated endonuclease Csn1
LKLFGQDENGMKRVFAFDPGTAAIGWAVLERDGENITIVAAGVRQFSLSRHRAAQKMKQRLKPEARMKLRQRMKLRRKALEVELTACGLLTTDVDARSWQRDDGSRVDAWLAKSLDESLTNDAIVRILFNVHKHRGAPDYGPLAQTPRQFVDAFLTFQARRCKALEPEAVRTTIAATIFRRRQSARTATEVRPVSPLAAIAHREFTKVWRALVQRHGMPDDVCMEAALPEPSKRNHATPPQTADLARRLAEIGRPPSRQNILRARLFLRQEVPETGLSRCSLTGSTFSFQDAFSAKVEIDHLVPVASGAAGGVQNLSLCLADANRQKGKALMPDAARGGSTYQSRAGLADADALRQAVRLAVAFLAGSAGAPAVQLVSPRLVANARTTWFDLGTRKDRSDLRHHAVDAMIAGVLSLRNSHDSAIAAAPREDLVSTIGATATSLCVSVRPERSRRGQLHDDTRYGRPSTQSGFDPQTHLTIRKPLEGLTKPMLKRLADPWLRRRVANAADEKQLADAFGRAKRVKVIRKAMDAIDIAKNGGTGAAAVVPTDNHHLDIVQLRCGTWKAFGAARHQVAQPGWRPDWERQRIGGKLVMRLHKGDMLEMQCEDGSTRLMTVVRISGSSGNVHVADHFRAGGGAEGETADGDARCFALAPNSLRLRDARAIDVGPGGDTRYRRSN